MPPLTMDVTHILAPLAAQLLQVEPSKPVDGTLWPGLGFNIQLIGHHKFSPEPYPKRYHTRLYIAAMQIGQTTIWFGALGREEAESLQLDPYMLQKWQFIEAACGTPSTLGEFLDDRRDDFARRIMAELGLTGLPDAIEVDANFYGAEIDELYCHMRGELENTLDPPGRNGFSREVWQLVRPMRLSTAAEVAEADFTF